MTNRDKNIVGQILAKTYRIERFLGVGTVGTVYVARHVRSGGLYAVKVLHRKLAASPDLYQRFQDEARLIATLRHPHILPITDFDRDENGIPFFVMDLLEGENLQQRLKHKEVLPVSQAMEVIQQVGSALHTAHRSGIVHRNIKPENIFLVRHDLGDRVTEAAKVMDFGLARFRRMAPAGTRDASLGVSAYMAPEMLQETNAPIDGRADQWALAVIAYRMLSGKPPFEDENPEEVLRQVINESPRPFPRMSPELPAHTVAAISRGMSKRREDRYESMMDFVRALSSRASSAAVPEVGGDAAAPQPRAVVHSGRVVTPMPPMSTGGSAVPPPVPAAAGGPVPPAPPSSATASANVPRPVPAMPSRGTPVTNTAAAPSAASPPPPILTAPPLLIPEDATLPSPPPQRMPSWGLLISGGVIAVLAGVGLTLLWEQRQHPRPPLPPAAVMAPKADVGPAQLVVEPLVAGAPNMNNTDGGGSAAAPVKVPPLRPAVEEVVPPPTTVSSAPLPSAPPPSISPVLPNPTPAQNPALATAPPRAPLPSGAAPAAPPASPPLAGVSSKPAASPSAPSPAAPANSSPYAPPAAAPAPAVAANPAAPPVSGSRQARDEVEELLGPSTPKPPVAAAVPPPSSTPAVPRPGTTPAPRPGTASKAPADSNETGEPAERSADKILEEAQAAYVGGERQRAIEMAMQVTRRSNPSDATRAWRFIGSAACSVRSTTLATRSYNNLAAPEHRQLLTELCKRNGLNFVDGQFVGE